MPCKLSKIFINVQTEFLTKYYFEKLRTCARFKNTVCEPTTGYLHPGSSLLELAPNVCALFVNIECVCHGLRT